MLILPGDPLFDLTLDTMPPPGWHNHSSEETALVKDLETGLLRPATAEEMWEYILGGELEEVEERWHDADY